jgi:alpha-galactosidase
MRSLVVVGVLVGVLALVFAGTASSAPYMGVDTYYAYGTNINEQVVVNLAAAVARRGLRADGYRYVWIDAGWWKNQRNPDGSITLDPAQWPQGMRWLTDYIHSLGLLAGIYTDAGSAGCGNGGSWGHYQQDANTFAAWGFDAVKMDYCGGPLTGLTPEQNYKAFRAALNATGRPILLNICDAHAPDGWVTTWTFGPVLANDSWRTGPDVGSPGYVTWANVLRNLDLNAMHSQAQSPGHYNDPDYIVPGATKTLRESQAQVTMWAMESAPLMLSADVPSMPAPLLALAENRDVIAVDQTGVPASQIRPGVWVKPFGLGRVVAVLNTSSTPMSTTVRGGTSVWVRDLWTGNGSRIEGRVPVTVPANAAALIQIEPAARDQWREPTLTR